MLAAEVHDFELQRMGSTSRYERAIREEGVTDKDGKYRGLGLPVDDPVVHNLMEARDAITAVEEGLIKALVKVMRQHPLGPWQKAQRGIGEKQLARLLNVIGDPYWNAAKNQPRRVSDLWSYCGLRQNADGVAVKRQRGEVANWSTEAKTRAYLIATSCLKQPPTAHYRAVYDEARAKYADAVHKTPCVRCGPSGKPAQPGSPLSPGHQHMRGMRAIMRELLRDLWIEARRLHMIEGQ